ncbi:MAG: dihydropteroate synthase [Planctomycetota bacterium]
MIEFECRPKIMGIVNVTPDSFSDGGQYHDTQHAIDHALQLADHGADILDVGGESTRPYSKPVETKEEIERVIPVISEIAKRTSVPISIDTSKAEVAKAAIDCGAEIINDVTGLEGDPAMLDVALKTGAGVCVMHMQGNPQNMQDNPMYENVTEEISSYLQRRFETLVAGGIKPEKICLDPGIGFGKTHEHNFDLLRNSHKFLNLGRPILVGHSRKGFIGKAIGDKEANRDFGTLAVSINLAKQNIHVLRVHNVEATKHGFDLWYKIEAM